jgi:hypothetical protein
MMKWIWESVGADSMGYDEEVMNAECHENAHAGCSGKWNQKAKRESVMSDPPSRSLQPAVPNGCQFSTWHCLHKSWYAF